MIKNKLHIVSRCLVLFIYVSWQAALCTHYHKEALVCDLVYNKHLKDFHFHKDHSEKCSLCTSAVHQPYFIHEPAHYLFRTGAVILAQYIQVENYFNSLSPVKARGPPVSGALAI